MDEASYAAFKRFLQSFPGKALNYASRIILANGLDVKFVLPSRNGLARDFRGLAGLMGFQYNEIKKFEQFDNPTMKVLKYWQAHPDSTLDKLIAYLEEIERYDVINDLIPLLDRSIETYLKNQKTQEVSPQMDKVTTFDSSDADTEFQGISCKVLNSINLKEKRLEYACKGDFKTLDDIVPWSEGAKYVYPHYPSYAHSNPDLNKKISMFVGDITELEIDAIVSSCSIFLDGDGGGVDTAIHRAAGPDFSEECEGLDGCIVGDAKITRGHKLPAKYVIHAVGPVGEKKELLMSCYKKSLQLAQKYNLRTIAFPCISTGIRGYPNDKAAHVALKTVRNCLDRSESSFDRIIFCLFLPKDVEIYIRLLQEYFPI